MASRLYKYTPAELQKLLDNSNNYADLLRSVGMSPYGGNRTALKRIIDEYDLDLTQINKNRRESNLDQIKSSRRIRKPLDEILKKDTPYNSSILAKRLIEEGYKEEKCERCGITEWIGRKIVFHLHHKDGDHDNNEFCNLELLCPNCHSQTDTYAGKSNNKKHKIYEKEEKLKTKSGISEDGTRLYDGYGNYKILCPVCNENFMKTTSQMCKKCYDKIKNKPKVSKEELFKIMETNSYCSAAKILGVDSKTVSRWHKYYANKERENGNMITGSDKIPPREVLKQKIRTMPFLQIGKEYDVSDNAIRKWCDTYGLPRKSSEIKSISDEEWEKI